MQMIVVKVTAEWRGGDGKGWSDVVIRWMDGETIDKMDKKKDGWTWSVETVFSVSLVEEQTLHKKEKTKAL